VRHEGNVISLVEYYGRHYLLPALDRIAAEPTWDRQRATCLTEILKETHWTNCQYVFKRAETDGGREIILGKLRKLWPKASNEEQVTTSCNFTWLRFVRAPDAGAHILWPG
jgi:hypothetical protein